MNLFSHYNAAYITRIERRTRNEYTRIERRLAIADRRALDAQARLVTTRDELQAAQAKFALSLYGLGASLLFAYAYILA